MMYLVNAAAFDARWEEAYGQEQLRAETFTCRGGGGKNRPHDVFHGTPVSDGRSGGGISQKL